MQSIIKKIMWFIEAGILKANQTDSNDMSEWIHLLFASQRPNYGDCLEVKREYYQNCSVLDCVTQCSQFTAHLYEQFLQVQQIRLVTLGYAVHKGSCLELYYLL